MKKAVIFGYTKSGKEIAKLLRDDEFELEIIDENPMQVANANVDGYFARHASLDDDKIFEDIGIGDSVDALFCTSDNDSLNLFVTLSARNLDKNLKILTEIKKMEDEKKMILAGANRTISPHSVGAAKAYRMINKPRVSRVLDIFSKIENKISIVEFEVLKGSKFDGKYFKDIDLSSLEDLIFLGLLDVRHNNEFIFFSRGVRHKIYPGDAMVLLGSKKNIKKFKVKMSETT
jgi:voltage-gated potassium channel